MGQDRGGYLDPFNILSYGKGLGQNGFPLIQLIYLVIKCFRLLSQYVSFQSIVATKN